MTEQAHAGRRTAPGLLAAVALALAIAFVIPLPGLDPSGRACLAVLGLVVVLWLTEALPIPATSLLPLLLLPLFGVTSPKLAAAPYADPILFLFMGGFMIALAIERWDLHSRIALNVLVWVGARPRQLLAGFIIATALLSMWISNTAAALMLIPTALGVAGALERATSQRLPALSMALVLAVAYAASIGGIATPVGSPTNLVAMGFLDSANASISFGAWMLLAMPACVLMLCACWLVLGRNIETLTSVEAAAHELEARRAALGPMGSAQRRVLWVFVAVALAWIGRPLLIELPGLSRLSDTGIALIGALLLFVLPAGSARGERLLDWPTAERLPWGVLLLFGAGLSLAAALGETGVTQWLGDRLQGLSALGFAGLLFTLVLLTVFVTELTSNTATLTALLPVLAALALGAGMPLVPISFAVALAASFAFMLPVATPPNAIAFASGKVTTAAMARNGLWLNVIAVVVLSALVWVQHRLGWF